ncbi:excalibur calcium-binding domain-containing protein [Microterricola viridarii]|uniref:Excalibur calcium-binding domain-containing protein n=1 Tax=Microterricola viridarii TaxID=412690 RepID=A0A0Y0MH66_9MICO|nr:excalibur calcium-binding domain-containing protein [Microterricola viridarii]AMB57670.1 hypothetical protein AWU67_00995 [Microterricola viridarii]
MLVAALTVGALVAVAPAAGSSASAETAGSTISGTIMLRDGTGGLARPAHLSELSANRDGVETALTLVNSDGSYILSGLTSGSYVLHVRSADARYFDEYYSDGSDAYDLPDATIVVLGPDEQLAGLDIELSDVKQFSSTPAPVLSGSPQVGQTLTSSVPSWSPTGAALNYQWKRSGTDMTGATSANYAIVAADLGHTLTLTVTGALDGYVAASQTSAATAAVSGVWAQTPAPSISGSAHVGQTLTATPGPWSPAATFSYQWKRAGAVISNATSSTYTLTTADFGKTLTVTVSGSTSNYATASATSAATAAVQGVFTMATAPTVSGTATVGSTLTAAAGVWSPTASFGYQWLRAGAAISGATASTYKPTDADVGKAISVTVTARAAGYVSAAKTSAATAAVQGLFTTAPTPTISGTTAVGQTLKAATGTWSPAATLSYQWKRSGAVIPGAIASTYRLATADLGKTLTVTTTASKLGYVSASKTSAATAAVLNVFAAAPTPTISGGTVPGQTLKATTGTWSPSATLGYQWLRSGAKITGATKSSYVLTSADLGKTLSLVVTGTKSGYLAVAKTSAATATVAMVFASAPAPTINGVPQAGNTLTASAGSWSPAPALAYQWKRSGMAIAGATGNRYVLKPTDADGVITVTVTAQKANFVTVSKTSAATKAVLGVKYANCDALNQAYPHGVAKPGVRYDKVSGVDKPFKGTPFFSAAVYALNPARDGDKDGIACER